MSGTATLRAGAEGLAGPMPALLAGARHLAASMVLGAHGRRRPGQGEEFWQYRSLVEGDEARVIDWRRSARSDGHFVRQMEWQSAQSVTFWVDMSRSMDFSSAGHVPVKSARAAELGLALAILLVRGGERVGLPGLPARSGEVQLMRMTQHLVAGDPSEHGMPDAREMPARSRAVFLSDFLGPMEPLVAAVSSAADRGISGALVQVLDPQEEAFPFSGRTVFESVGGTMRHETLHAGDLRGRYLERLAERKAALRDLARTTGWQYALHHTSEPGAGALLWLYGATERVL